MLAVAATVLVAAGPASAEPDPATRMPPHLPSPTPRRHRWTTEKVASTPPATTKSPDGWTLKISAKDETQMPAAPLTTAISSREYIVGGTFNGSPVGGDSPKGVFEVGYQIGCGIDMSTSNGVSLTGTAGVSPSITYFGFDFDGVVPDGIAPTLGANLAGGITVGLKPGIINVVPVTKKAYRGRRAVGVDQQLPHQDRRLRGESFIRSYAIRPSRTTWETRSRPGTGSPRRSSARQSQGNRLTQRFSSPITPIRKASMREKPAGTAHR